MKSEQYWSVYDCSIVDLGEGGAGYPKLPRAIRIDRDKELKKAVALPRGFVTKVLLDYDFSDDGQVLSFLREYGPVMCPYAGAIDRTFAAIEDPLSYRRLLHSVVSERQAEDERRDGGAFARLFSIVRDMRDRMGSRRPVRKLLGVRLRVGCQEAVLLRDDRQRRVRLPSSGLPRLRALSRRR